MLTVLPHPTNFILLSIFRWPRDKLTKPTHHHINFQSRIITNTRIHFYPTEWVGEGSRINLAYYRITFWCVLNRAESPAKRDCACPWRELKWLQEDTVASFPSAQSSKRNRDSTIIRKWSVLWINTVFVIPLKEYKTSQNASPVHDKEHGLLGQTQWCGCPSVAGSTNNQQQWTVRAAATTANRKGNYCPWEQSATTSAVERD